MKTTAKEFLACEGVIGFSTIVLVLQLGAKCI